MRISERRYEVNAWSSQVPLSNNSRRNLYPLRLFFHFWKLSAECLEFRRQVMDILRIDAKWRIDDEESSAKGAFTRFSWSEPSYLLAVWPCLALPEQWGSVMLLHPVEIYWIEQRYSMSIPVLHAFTVPYVQRDECTYSHQVDNRIAQPSWWMESLNRRIHHRVCSFIEIT